MALFSLSREIDFYYRCITNFALLHDLASGFLYCRLQGLGRGCQRDSKVLSRTYSHRRLPLAVCL